MTATALRTLLLPLVVLAARCTLNHGSNSSPPAQESVRASPPISQPSVSAAGGMATSHQEQDSRETRQLGDTIGLNVKFTQGQPLEQLSTLVELGVRWVRDTVDWASLERKPGQFATFPPEFEQRLSFYKRHGIGVVFLLAYGNDVAYPATAAQPHAPIAPTAFGRYAAVVAERLRASGVRFVLEIWNEPHNFVIGPMLSGTWNGSPPAPWLEHYLKMVQEAVRQVKAVDPTVRLLSDDDMWIIHYWYLERGLPKALDGFAFHPYTLASPERVAVDQHTDWLRPFRVVDPDGSFASAVRLLREQGQRKLGHVPEMWATEWGWKLGQPSPWGPVTEGLLASWLPRAYVVAAAAGVRVVCWFSAFDSVDGPLGLITNEGRKRKPYFALRTLSEQLGDAVFVQHAWGKGRDTHGTQAFVFQGARDTRLILWNVDGGFTRIELTGPLLGSKVVDVFGQPIHPDIRDGVHSLTLGAAPYYLRFDKHLGALDLQAQLR